MTGRPATSEYAPYYDTYVRLVEDGDIAELLARQTGESLAAWRAISEEQSRFRYAPDKWTIKQVLGHISDAERIFAYRALAFSRGESKALPGFEQDDYVALAGSDARTWASLVDEIATVRAATVSLFRSLGEEALVRVGTASNNPITVRALGFIIAGHERHHLGVLKAKYVAAADYPAR